MDHLGNVKVVYVNKIHQHLHVRYLNLESLAKFLTTAGYSKPFLTLYSCTSVLCCLKSCMANTRSKGDLILSEHSRLGIKWLMTLEIFLQVEQGVGSGEWSTQKSDLRSWPCKDFQLFINRFDLNNLPWFINLNFKIKKRLVNFTNTYWIKQEKWPLLWETLNLTRLDMLTIILKFIIVVPNVVLVWCDYYQAPKESRCSKGQTHSQPVGIRHVRLWAGEHWPGSNWQRKHEYIKLFFSKCVATVTDRGL